MVHGDKSRYMQIFLNFLSNAIKFTQPGGKISLRIVILEIQNIAQSTEGIKIGEAVKIYQASQDFKLSRSSEVLKRQLKFAIEFQDTGVGISEENQKNLFINFGKLDEHSSINQKGTGLGLSICKKIIEQMGGKINFTSELNVGTTFIINQLIEANCSRTTAKPLSLNQSGDMNQILEQDDFDYQEDSFEIDSEPKGLYKSDNVEHALVVNDEYFIIVCLSEILKEEGYVIKTSYNG